MQISVRVMPLSSSAIDAFGIVTLLFVVISCLIGAFSLFCVIYFHSKIRGGRLLDLRAFDSPWIARILLIGFAVLWSLVELLRLPLLRSKSGWFLHSASFAWQSNLCRVHVVSSLGLLQPGFFLTALFLLQASVHNVPLPFRRLNGKVLSLVASFGLPIFLVQSLLMLTSSSSQFHKSYSEDREGFGGSLPSYFTRSFEKVSDETNRSLALCTYPLFSILLQGLSVVLYIAYFAFLGTKMLHLVINRKLQMRLYCLVLAVVVLLPLNVTFLGVSAWIEPNETMHEVLILLGFLTMLLCTTVGEGILVVRPAMDSLAVCYIFENRYRRGQSSTTNEVEPFDRSIPVFANEELSLYVARENLLEKEASGDGLDAQSSSREASLSFDTMLKEITLGPGSQVGDIILPVLSPSSPALPGKLLISFPGSCNM